MELIGREHEPYVTCSFCGVTSEERRAIVTAQTTDKVPVWICEQCAAVLRNATEEAP